MSLFQQQNTFKKIVYSWITLAAIVLFIFLMIEQIYSFYYKNEKIKEKLAVNEKKVQRLSTELDAKKKDFEFLSTDRGQEEYYRSVYSVGKEGEKVIILYNSTNTDEESSNVNYKPDFWTEFKKKVQYFVDNYTNL